MPLINKPGLLFTMITGGHSALEEGIFCQFSVIFFFYRNIIKQNAAHATCLNFLLTLMLLLKRSISATVFSGDINLECEKCSFLTIYNVFSLSVFGNISNPKGAVL